MSTLTVHNAYEINDRSTCDTLSLQRCFIIRTILYFAWEDNFHQVAS